MDDQIALQLKIIQELQQKMRNKLNSGAAAEIKDVAIALNAAVDTLAALTAMHRLELGTGERDRAFSEFQARRKGRSDDHDK